MIRGITEVNLPSYATLHQATVSFQDMGDRTITSQVRIDGNIVPSFVGTDGKDWTLMFRGQKFIMPIRKPQASRVTGANPWWTSLSSIGQYTN